MDQRSLNILIIEDNKDHIFAAKEMLKEHNVTVAENAHDAAELLAGGRYPRYEGVTRQMIASERFDAYDHLTGHLIEKGNFDVMLTDAKLPIAIGPYSQLSHPLKYEGQIFEFGYPLVLLAAREGVPRIGMLTDTNHHDDPVTTLFGYFHIKKSKGKEGTRYERVKMRINESIFMCSDEASLLHLNGEFVKNIGGKSTTENGVIHQEDYYRRQDGTKFTVRSTTTIEECKRAYEERTKVCRPSYKNWKGLLDDLLAA